MTSKSLFSKLLREDLKRRTWAIALAMIGFFFALPINLALTMENAQADNFYRYNNYESLDAVQWSSPEQKAARILELKSQVALDGAEFGNGLLAFLMITTAVVMGVSSFAYLHNKRKVDFYHSLPVRRELFYLVQYMGGFLIIAGTYLLNLVFYLGVSAAYQIPLGNILGGILGGWLLNLLYFLLIYGTAVTAVMLTGHLLVGVLAAGVLLFFLPAVVLVLDSYTDLFFGTQSYYWTDLSEFQIIDCLKWISPFTAYLYALGWGMEELAPHIPALVITFFVSLGLAFFSMELYRKRPLEAAGRAMAFKISASPIRFLMVWGFGVMGALFFWVIQSRPYWAVFGAIMGALISHCVIEVIYHFDFKKLFSHWAQLVLAAALSVAVFMSFRYDWWGYDSWIPDAGKVESAAVVIDLDDGWLNNHRIVTGEDGKQTLEWGDGGQFPAEQMVLTDLDLILPLVEDGIRQEKETKEARFNSWKDSPDVGGDLSYVAEAQENPTVWVTLNVAYRMESGGLKGRQYSMGLNRELLEDYGRLYSQEAYKKGLYKIFLQSPGELAWARYEEMDLSAPVNTKESLESLLEAYQADLLELTVEERLLENPVGRLMFVNREEERFLEEHANRPGHYIDPGRDTYTEYEVCQSWPVYPSFKRTMACLKDAGIDAGKGMAPEKVSRITHDLYSLDEFELQDAQSVNSYIQTVSGEAQLVFENPEDIRLILSAFTEFDNTNYNGLCPVRGGSDLRIYMDGSTACIDGALQENKITPQIKALFEGTGVFWESN